MWQTQSKCTGDSTSSDDSSYIDNLRIINDWVYRKCIERSNINLKFDEKQLKLWAIEAKELYLKNDISALKIIPDDKWINELKKNYSIIEDNNNQMYVIPKKMTEEELRGHMLPCDEEMDFIEEVENLNQINNNDNNKIILNSDNIVGINMNNIELINPNKNNSSQNHSNTDNDIQTADPLQTVSIENQLNNESIDENALNIYTYSKCQEFNEKKIKFGDKELQEWAIEAAKLCAFPNGLNFKLSENWLNKFKKTNGLVGDSCNLQIIEDTTINQSINSYNNNHNHNSSDHQMNTDDFLQTPSSSHTNLNVQNNNYKVKNIFNKNEKLDEINQTGLDLSIDKNNSSIDTKINKKNQLELVDLTLDDDDDADDNDNDNYPFDWIKSSINIKIE